MNNIPGQNVGIIAAQSLGANLTQQMLNAFHSCGAQQQTATVGVPRLIEILNLTQKPSITNYKIHLLKKVALSNFQEVNLEMMTKNYRLETRNNIPGICVNLDLDKIINLKIKPELIINLCEQFCLTVELSPFFELFIARSSNNLEHETWPELKKAKICGLKKIYYAEYESELCVNTSARFDQALYGSINKLSFVDPYKTFSNNVWDIYKCFGIEATRTFLTNELRQIVGPQIHEQHISCIVNQMTWSGTPCSFSRYTLRADPSVFTRASFEETMLNFQNAAFKGETDDLSGVSGAVITGNRGKNGTGSFDLLIRDNL